MRHIKKQEDFSTLNEMAKGFPVGMVIKVSKSGAKPNDLGKTEGYNNWSTFEPNQAKGAEGGYFYMKITESGRAWLEGPIIYANCLTNDNVLRIKARTSTKNNEAPGDEYRIFQKNDDKIKEIMKKTFFLDGSEAGIMSNDGKTTSISEAEYMASGLNFKLTDLYDEPVFWMVKKAGGRSSTTDGFSIKLSDITTLTKELSEDQKVIIATWFGKQIKGDVEINGDKFQISHYKIQSSETGVYPSSFSAGPFLNAEQAQKVIDLIKKEDITLFNTANLKVDTDRYSKSNLNLEEMIVYAKTVGITTTMKELLALKKGEVAGKKFGI